MMLTWRLLFDAICKYHAIPEVDLLAVAIVKVFKKGVLLRSLLKQLLSVEYWEFKYSFFIILVIFLH